MATIYETIGLKAVLEGVSGYLSNLGKMEKAEKDLGDEATRTEKKTKDMGSALTKMSMVGVTAFVGLGAMAVKFAMGFENQMSQVGAILQANDEDMAKLSATAKQLGADTAFSAGEAAKAMEELAAGGRTVAQIIGGEATAAVALAAAGNYDLANSARTIATTMDVWKDTQIDTNDVVNRLAGAANSSRFGVDDMSQAIASGGGVAAQAGVSFQDFSTVIAATASSFNSGSDAGTSFKTFVTSLTGNSEKAKDMIRDLGLEFYTAQGQLKPMTEIVQELNTAMSGLSQEQQTVALKTIFGNDAFRTAAGLMKMTGDEFTAMSQKMANTNASDVAKQRMDNLSGSMEQLKGSAETLAIATGERVIPALTLLAQGATIAVNAFSAMPSSTQNMVLGFTALVVALPALIGGFEKAAKAVQGLSTAMSTGRLIAMGWAAIIAAAIIGLDVLSQKMTGVSLTERVFGDVAGAQAATKSLKDWNTVIQAMGPNVDRVALAQQELATKTAGATDAFATLGKETKTTFTSLLGDNIGYQTNKILGLQDGLSSATEKTKQFNETTKTLGAQMVTSGASIYQLKQTFDALPEPLRAAFDSTTNINAAWKEMEERASAGGDRIEAMRRAGIIPLTDDMAAMAAEAEAAKTPLDKLRESFENGEMKADDFSKALDELSGRFADFNPQIIQAQGQLAAVDEELADLARSGGTWSESLGMTKDQLIAQKKALEGVIEAADENQKATKGMRDELLLYMNQGLYNLEFALEGSNVALEDQITVQQGVAKALRALSKDDIPGFVTALESIEKKMPGVSAIVVSNLGPELAQKLRTNIPELEETGSALGGSIADGLKRGLDSAANRIVAAGRGLVRGLIEGMEAEAVIDSPSKITTYQGKMIAEGLLVGIEGASPAVKKAGAALVGEIQENMNERIVDWVNSLGDDVKMGLKDVFETIPWREYGLFLNEDMSLEFWKPVLKGMESRMGDLKQGTQAVMQTIAQTWKVEALGFGQDMQSDLEMWHGVLKKGLEDNRNMSAEEITAMFAHINLLINDSPIAGAFGQMMDHAQVALLNEWEETGNLSNAAMMKWFDDMIGIAKANAPALAAAMVVPGMNGAPSSFMLGTDGKWYPNEAAMPSGVGGASSGIDFTGTPYEGMDQNALVTNGNSAYFGMTAAQAYAAQQAAANKKAGDAGTNGTVWDPGAQVMVNGRLVSNPAYVYPQVASFNQPKNADLGYGYNGVSNINAFAAGASGGGGVSNSTAVTIDMRGAQLTGTIAENEAMIYKVVTSALKDVAGRDAFVSGVKV